MSNTALITGASSGIGRELARIHAERGGGDLVIVARSTDKLDALKAELEAAHEVAVHAITEDLAEEGAAQRVFDALAGKQIDVLINNAGFGGRGLFHERDWDARDGRPGNDPGQHRRTDGAHPPDPARHGGARCGAGVLNVSSTASLMAGPLQAVYFATKGLCDLSFSNALVGELHDSPRHGDGVDTRARRIRVSRTCRICRTRACSTRPSARARGGRGRL